MVTGLLAIINSRWGQWYLWQLQIMCKAVHTVAVLARLKQVLTTAVVLSTVSAMSTTDNAVPTHGGGTPCWPPSSPEVKTLVFWSTFTIMSAVSIVGGSLEVLAVAILAQAPTSRVKSILHFLLATAKSRPSCFYRKYVNMHNQIADCQPFQLDFSVALNWKHFGYYLVMFSAVSIQCILNFLRD